MEYQDQLHWLGLVCRRELLYLILESRLGEE